MAPAITIDEGRQSVVERGPRRELLVDHGQTFQSLRARADDRQVELVHAHFQPIGHCPRGEVSVSLAHVLGFVDQQGTGSSTLHPGGDHVIEVVEGLSRGQSRKTQCLGDQGRQAMGVHR